MCSDKESPVIISELGDRVLLDISVLIDCLHVSALIDTGADYSIIRGKLAMFLNKVMVPWNGTHIRPAGRHIVILLGCCKIRALTFRVTWPHSP